MQVLKITTKGKANKIQVESLFRPVNGRTLSRARFDRGKYRPDRDFIGREVEVGDNVKAVWVESRRDADGPYKALFCLIAN